jgi:hypothetical protein
VKRGGLHRYMRGRALQGVFCSKVVYEEVAELEAARSAKAFLTSLAFSSVMS